MICARCGKETKDFYDNLCLDCFIEKMKNIEINLRVCKKCNRFFVSNRGFEEKERAIDYYLKKFVSKKISLEIDKIPIEKLDVFEKEFICNECKEKYSRKVEAILQVRGKENLVEEIFRKYLIFGRKVVGGYDIDFSSKEELKKIVKEIKKKYLFEVKISRKLIGIKGGKRKYKDTVLLKLYGKR
ncbi:MAG: NMD3-related protein [Candidatus Aenigmatarchaeota archaeon]